jgi:HEPN domain-containing protein
MGKFLSQYEILLKKAKTDFSAAVTLYAEIISGNQELDFEVVYFHLQQAAEKIFKALLSKHKINYPKIHDLDTLLIMVLEQGIDFQVNSDLLIELNDYAVDGRYTVYHDYVENLDYYFTMVSGIIQSAEKIISD